jgi:hypothetical protein
LGVPVGQDRYPHHQGTTYVDCSNFCVHTTPAHPLCSCPTGTHRMYLLQIIPTLAGGALDPPLWSWASIVPDKERERTLSLSLSLTHSRPPSHHPHPTLPHFGARSLAGWLARSSPHPSNHPPRPLMGSDCRPTRWLSGLTAASRRWPAVARIISACVVIWFSYVVIV